MKGIMNAHRIISLSVSAAIAISSIQVPLPAYDPDADGLECTPVEIISFRGSGEQQIPLSERQYPGGVATDGWEGGILSRVLDAYTSSYMIDPMVRGYDLADIKFTAVGSNFPEPGYGYPAYSIQVDPTDLFTDLFNYVPVLKESALNGSAAALRYISQQLEATPEGCEPTRYIALGYSQGAMAARYLQSALPDDVVGMVLVGDPYQKAYQKGSHGTGADGFGIAYNFLSDEERDQLNSDYAASEYASSLCHQSDPFCDFDWAGGLGHFIAGDFGEHENYLADDQNEINQKGNELNVLVRSAINMKLGPEIDPNATEGGDLMIMIDTGGNLDTEWYSSSILHAKAVADYMLTNNFRPRVGLTIVGPLGSSAENGQLAVPFTDDITVFNTLLDSTLGYTRVYSSGGNTYEAIRSVANDSSWRPNATKHIWMYNRTVPSDAATTDRVALGNELKDAGVHFSIGTLLNQSWSIDAMHQITSATGGIQMHQGVKWDPQFNIVSYANHFGDSDLPAGELRWTGKAVVGYPLTMSVKDISGAYGYRDAGPYTYQFAADSYTDFGPPQKLGANTYELNHTGDFQFAVKITDSKGRSSILYGYNVWVVNAGSVYYPVNPENFGPNAVRNPVINSTQFVTGDQIEVSVPELKEGEQFAIRLVDKSDETRWYVDPIEFSAPQVAGDTAVIDTDGVDPGAYNVLIITNENGYYEYPVNITR